MSPTFGSSGGGVTVRRFANVITLHYSLSASEPNRRLGMRRVILNALCRDGPDLFIGVT